ncbi:MAG: hypothetical protein ACI358_05600 [Candidatus Limimorpha sp.]
MESKPASKETIASFIQNAGITIQELYIVLKQDFAIRSTLDESMPHIYSVTHDIQMGIKFILMDIGVSCRALFQTNYAYEKRFHLKNILASISEGFKAIMNFGKSRKYALWNLLEEEIINIANSDLFGSFNKIRFRLIEFGEKRIDKDIRDLTLHYDDAMIKVFEKTTSLNSEEDTMKLLCDFWAILQDMLKFTYTLDEYTKANTGFSKPDEAVNVQLDVNRDHKVIKLLIDNKGKLEAAISTVLPQATNQLDNMANHYFQLQKIRKYIREEAPCIVEFSELDNLETLANHELLIRFMALDLASVLNAYLHSDSDIEASLNLRRIVVIKTSTLVHLYGYDEREHEKSVWKNIKTFIPSDNEVLKSEEQAIQELLSKLVTESDDKNLRASLVHLFDNGSHMSNIEETLVNVESLDPAKQTVEILLLMEVYKKMEAFTKRLMNTLALNARLQREASQKEMLDKIVKMRQLIEHSNAPQEITDSFLQMMDKIQNAIL